MTYEAFYRDGRVRRLKLDEPLRVCQHPGGPAGPDHTWIVTLHRVELCQGQRRWYEYHEADSPDEARRHALDRLMGDPRRSVR